MKCKTRVTIIKVGEARKGIGQEPQLGACLKRIFSFVAPRQPAFGAKTAPLGIFRQALKFF
jgi:hypothetical protein